MRFLISFCGKKTIAILLLLSLGIVVLELLSIALIFPFLALFSSPDKIETLRPVRFVFQLYHFGSHRNFLLFLGGCFILLYVLKFFAKYYLVKTRNWTMNSVTLKLTTSLFGNLLQANYELFTSRSASEMVGIVNAHTVHSIICLNSWVNIISELVFLIIAIVGLLMFDFRIALVLFGGFGLIGGLLYFVLVKRISRRGQIHSNLNLQVYRFAFSVSHAIKDIKIMGLEKNFFDTFQEIWLRYTKNDSISKSLQIIPREFAEVVVFCVLILFCMYLLIINKNILELLPTLGIVAMGSFKLLPSFNKIIGSFNEFRYYQGSLKVVEELYSVVLSRKQTIEHIEKKFNRSIEVRGLSFSYGDKKILDTLSFSIQKGTSVAFVGASGVGKSTILDILIGLRLPEKGDFLLDGESFDPFGTDIIRSRIGYVPQNVAIIDNTIAFNISFEREYNKERMDRVIEMARLNGFVMEQPAGLDALVGESGVRLSGGQRQRIGIARALYREPEILVFDEATSSLDNITESELMEEIYQLKGQKTLLIVAHRLTTIERCDTIFVLDQGKIVGRGKHSELLLNCPLYIKLYQKEEK